MSRELFPTTRQKCKIRNALANNILLDIKVSKSKFSEIFHSGGFLSFLLGKVVDTLMKVGVPFARKPLALLAITVSANTMDGTIQTKMCQRGAIVTSGADVVRAEKGITLKISNEDMDDIIKIAKSLKIQFY